MLRSTFKVTLPSFLVFLWQPQYFHWSHASWHWLLYYKLNHHLLLVDSKPTGCDNRLHSLILQRQLATLLTLRLDRTPAHAAAVLVPGHRKCKQRPTEPEGRRTPLIMGLICYGQEP
eukprot:4338167-Amphidinium_carterae.1